MSNDNVIRAFLAIEPPPETLREIGKIQGSLRRACPFEVRWVKSEGMHLTLKFFGNICAAEIRTLSPVVEKFTAPLPPLHLNVRKLGFFPAGRHPRVLWIGLEGDVAPLLVLQNDLEQGLENCSFARETRPFRPHLTLGRIKPARSSDNAEEFLAGRGDCAAGSFVAAGLGLIQSDLTPRGAVYTQLAWFPFGG